MRWFLAALLILCVFVPRSAGAITADEYCQSPQEVEMLGYVNQYRIDNGVQPLRPITVIGAAARHHAVDALTTWNATAPHYWIGHQMSDGTDWAQNMQAHGYTAYAWTGENTALRGPDTVYRHFEAFTLSPSHNEGLLNPNWRVIGIGWQEDAGTSVSYIDFGQSADNGALDNSYATAPVCGQPTPTAAPPTATYTAAPPTPTNTPKPKKCPPNNPHC